MCRWLVYLGDKPVPLADVITRPAHSLTKQSLRLTPYTPGCKDSDLYDAEKHLIRNHSVNPDGFGIGWYTFQSVDSVASRRDEDSDSSDIADSDTTDSRKGSKGGRGGRRPCAPPPLARPTPAIYKTPTAPWADANLHEIVSVTESRLLFAHTRAASSGGISRANCHPFRQGRFMFMHNGGISEFTAIKRRLQSLLRDDVFHQITGDTDSEHAFALFCQQFENQGIYGREGRYVVTHDDKDTISKRPSETSEDSRRSSKGDIPGGIERISFPEVKLEQMKNAMRNTILLIMALQEEAGVPSDTNSLNFAVSDGTFVIVTRCRTNPAEDPPSLYYSMGTGFTPLEGVFDKQGSDTARPVGVRGNSHRREYPSSMIVASEPLEFDTAGPDLPRWHLIAKDTLLAISPADLHSGEEKDLGKLRTSEHQLSLFTEKARCEGRELLKTMTANGSWQAGPGK